MMDVMYIYTYTVCMIKWFITKYIQKTCQFNHSQFLPPIKNVNTNGFDYFKFSKKILLFDWT